MRWNLKKIIELNQLFTKLKLETFSDELSNNLGTDADEVIIDLLHKLCVSEIEHRTGRSSMMRLKVANFPEPKTIEEFDFKFNESIDKNRILKLATLKFIDEGKNILLLGTPGVGKTHLATAIGSLAAHERHSTYFIHAHKLIQNLHKAMLENKLDERLKKYASYKVLVIDEVGYLPFGKEAGELLFQLINLRYKRNSTIITSNLSLGK